MTTTQPTAAGVQPAPRRLIRLSYSNKPAEQEFRPRLHQLRDGAAFDELASVLHWPQYQYKTVYHLYPDCRRRLVDYPPIQDRDVLVLPTRPPYGQQMRNKPISPSGCEIEHAIFAELGRIFERTARGEVRLRSEIANRFDEPLRDLERCMFCAQKEGTLREIRNVNARNGFRRIQSDRIMVGYFLHAALSAIPGCHCIVSFSMGGYENLLWNHWVRCHRPAWLERPTFAMVELLLQPIDDPVSPEAADGILGVPLPESQILKACQGPLDKRASGYFVLQEFTP